MLAGICLLTLGLRQNLPAGASHAPYEPEGGILVNFFACGYGRATHVKNDTGFYSGQLASAINAWNSQLGQVGSCVHLDQDVWTEGIDIWMVRSGHFEDGYLQWVHSLDSSLLYMVVQYLRARAHGFVCLQPVAAGTAVASSFELSPAGEGMRSLPEGAYFVGLTNPSLRFTPSTSDSVRIQAVEHPLPVIRVQVKPGEQTEVQLVITAASARAGPSRPLITEPRTAASDDSPQPQPVQALPGTGGDASREGASLVYLGAALIATSVLVFAAGYRRRSSSLRQR